MKLFLLSVKTYFAHFGQSFALGFSFLVVSVSCLIIGFLSPIAIIATVIFLLLPFYTAFLVSSTSIRHNQGLSNAVIRRSFRNHFTVFSGCYSIIVNLIKGVLIGVIASFAFRFIYLYIGGKVNPDWLEQMNDFTKSISSMPLNQVYETLEQHSDIYRFIQISTLFGVGIGLFTFFYCIGYKSMNLYVRSFFFGIPKPISNYFYRQNMRTIRFKYLSDFFLNTLVFVLLYAGGFILGSYLGIANNLGVGMSITLGLILGFGFISLFLPILGYLVEFLANKYMKSFLVSSISSAENLINSFRAKGLEEEAEALENIKINLQARLTLSETLPKNEDLI